MKNLLKITFLCLAVGLASCGNKKDEKKNNGNPSGENAETNNFKGGNPCGSQVIIDHTDLVGKFQLLKMSPDKTKCTNLKKSVESFIAKYPGINCTAKRDSDTLVDGETVTITEQKMRDIITELDDLGC